MKTPASPSRLVESPKWSAEDLQRVLYHVVNCYEQAYQYHFVEIKGNVRKERKTPRRFILFGKRLPFLGGDSEFLLDAIRIGRQALKDNNWWPDGSLDLDSYGSR